MPLFLDIHQHIPGLTAEAVAGAHAKDLQTQAKYGVKYLKYWFDESTGKVFCLAEAPSKEAATAVIAKRTACSRMRLSKCGKAPDCPQ